MSAETSPPPRELGKNFAEFLGAMQLLSGYNREQMASLVGVSGSTIRNWLDGQTVPHAKFYPQLTEAFDLSQEELERLGQAPDRRVPQLRTELIQAFTRRFAAGPIGENELSLFRRMLEMANTEDAGDP